MRRLLTTTLTAACLALAACGGDDEPTVAESTPAETTAPTATTEPAEPAGAEGGEAVEIGMRGLQFEPRDVTVAPGTTITWKNDEDIPHNVVAEKGADFESDTFGRDGTFTFEAEEAGVVEYVCTLHPGMEGTLTVEG